MKHIFTILCILSVFILADCSTENSKLVGFTKRIDVFGIHIVATETTPDDKILHAANVMAEYIDNNEVRNNHILMGRKRNQHFPAFLF